MFPIKHQLDQVRHLRTLGFYADFYTAAGSRHARTGVHSGDTSRGSSGEAKDEFLAMPAHELRNPLAPLRELLEVMKRSDDGPARRQPFLSITERRSGGREF